MCCVVGASQRSGAAVRPPGEREKEVRQRGGPLLARIGAGWRHDRAERFQNVISRANLSVASGGKFISKNGV